MNKPLSLMTAVLLLGSCTLQKANIDPASTIVNPDGTVTFNYRNDHAAKVQVDVQFAGRRDMVRDSLSGLWSLTLGPVQPDMYPYCFVVDGVSIMDPQCPGWFPNEGFKNSLLDIPGKESPLIHALQEVPHGQVDYVTYYSEVIGCYNQALVYTPASYSNPSSADKRYPVFYLISGTTDTEEVYYKAGRMNVIADNLIARGNAEEMIIVLPYGNPSKLIASDNGPKLDVANDLFSLDLHTCLMPYVEGHYRTINNADHRAIGGFSRGGNQALSNGLMHLDKFSYLCSYSSFTSTDLPGVYDNAKATNAKINLFWLGIGTDDFLYKNSHDYLEFLDKKGIRHCMEFTVGKFGHTWMNAKYFLSHTLPLLFNKEASAKVMNDGIMPMPALRGDEQPFTPEVMARMFPRPIVSPDLGQQGEVTFRIKAASASEVMLEGDWLETPLPMVCDSDGVWSITVKDLSPDVYCYNFQVDGTQVADPTNMYLAPDKGFKRSIAFLPGTSTHAASTVTVKICPETQHSYMEISGNKDLAECNGPTLYLLAGPNDSFESWMKIGHAHQMIEELAASGKCSGNVRLILMDAADYSAHPGDNVISSADYANWRECRRALAERLNSL